MKRSATGSATTQSNLDEQVLQTACKTVVDDIVDTLVALTPFSVLDVENGEVTVDVPSNRVKPGQRLALRQPRLALKRAHVDCIEHDARTTRKVKWADAVRHPVLPHPRAESARVVV